MELIRELFQYAFPALVGYAAYIHRLVHQQDKELMTKLSREDVDKVVDTKLKPIDIMYDSLREDIKDIKEDLKESKADIKKLLERS